MAEETDELVQNRRENLKDTELSHDGAEVFELTPFEEGIRADSKCTPPPVPYSHPLSPPPNYSQANFRNSPKEEVALEYVTVTIPQVPLQTNDGVFTNLTAKPEVMILPLETESDPPPYEAGALNDRFFPTNTQNSWAQEFDEIIIDDKEVGSYWAFSIFMLVTLCFSYFGFAVGYFCAPSHAAAKGSIAGLGIVVALQSISFDDFANTSPFWALHRDLQSFICFIMAFGGYCMLLFGFFTYQGYRNDALAIHSSYRR